MQCEQVGELGDGLVATTSVQRRFVRTFDVKTREPRVTVEALEENDGGGSGALGDVTGCVADSALSECSTGSPCPLGGQ